MRACGTLFAVRAGNAVPEAQPRGDQFLLVITGLSDTWWQPGSLVARLVELGRTPEWSLTVEDFMARRSHMSRGSSRRSFRKGAQRVHPKNLMAAPMRGGIRL